MARPKSMTGVRKTFRINNMIGMMNTMAEDNSYLSIDPNANMGFGAISVPFEFKMIDNWAPINRGGMSKTFGFSTYKDVGSSTPITGLYRYIRSNGNSSFIVSYGTNVYTLSAGTLTSITMTVANTYLDFETAYDKMIVCDGTNNPQTYDGSTVANLATGGDATAIAGARQSLFYANRLFIFSSTHDRSLLYFSDAGDIAAGYSANFIQCDVNDGQNITGITKFFIPGTLEPIIIVAKERSIGVVTGDGSIGNPYTFSKISLDLGVPGFRQIAQFGQDATFLTPRGISSYQTAVQNNNIQQQLLSRNITNQFTALNPAYISSSLCWFDWKHRRITYAVPTGNSQYPNTLWHYDIELGGFYKQTGFDVTAAFVDTDGVLYTGNSTGKIYEHDPLVDNYAGGSISSSLITPYLDFFEPDYYKRINHARIVVRGDGDYTLGVSTKINYGTSQGSSHSVPVTAGSYVWGGGNWNDDDSYLWGSVPLKRKKFFPRDIFENISFEFTQVGADQPVDLIELVIEIEYLNLI